MEIIIIITIVVDVFKISKRIESIERRNELSCLDRIVVVVRRISHEDVEPIETTTTTRRAILARKVSIMI